MEKKIIMETTPLWAYLTEQLVCVLNGVNLHTIGDLSQYAKSEGIETLYGVQGYTNKVADELQDFMEHLETNCIIDYALYDRITSVRVIHILQSHNIVTARDLLQYAENKGIKSLLNTQNCGKKSREVIVKLLEEAKKWQQDNDTKDLSVPNAKTRLVTLSTFTTEELLGEIFRRALATTTSK